MPSNYIAVSTDLFEWEPEHKRFLIDFSVLRNIVQGYPFHMKEIKTIFLRSSRTNVVLEVPFERLFYRINGDVSSWVYRYKSQLHQPHLEFTVVIQNY